MKRHYRPEVATSFDISYGYRLDDVVCRIFGVCERLRGDADNYAGTGQKGCMRAVGGLLDMIQMFEFTK